MRAKLEAAARRLGAWLGRTAGLWLAAAAGFGWFVYWAGWAVLDPQNLGWLVAGGDWQQHLMGWLFFRNEPWALPLGRLDGYVHPIGTTIGFTDTTPWVAVLLKPLSPLLPERFQFIGGWLALCFALQGAAGGWLAKRHGGGTLAQVGAGALFAFSPVLASRVGHESLCAHFVLVLLIGLHTLKVDSARQAMRHLAAAGALVAFAAGVHPYLAAMAVALAVALPWKLVLADRRVSVAFAAGASAGLVLVAVGVFALFGYFATGGGLGESGFGQLNADLLALVNPRTKSRFLPELPSLRGHYEGYGYLGLGGLLAVGFAAASGAIRRRHLARISWRLTLPLGLATLGLSLYAFGTEISVGHTVLLRLHGLYRHLEVLTGPFRGSGRFIWSLHYVALAVAVLVSVKAWIAKRWIPGSVLLLAATLQAADFDLKPGNLFVREAGPSGLTDPLWDTMGEEYRHLALVPPRILWAGRSCGGELWPSLMWYLGYKAYQQHLTFNSGHLARTPPQVTAYCQSLGERVARGDLEPSTVYVLGEPTLDRLLSAGGSEVTCGRVDGYAVCVSARAPTRFEAALRARPL